MLRWFIRGGPNLWGDRHSHREICEPALAITTATAIKTGEPNQQPTLLREFVLSLQGHIEDNNHEDDVH
jgi:hypothetical protein